MGITAVWGSRPDVTEKKLFDAIVHFETNEGNMDWYSEATLKFAEDICEKIERQIFADSRDSYSIQDAVYDLTGQAASDGLEQGFWAGVQAAKAVLLAEPVYTEQPQHLTRKPFRNARVRLKEMKCPDMTTVQEKDLLLIRMFQKYIPLLSDMSKGRLQARLETLAEKEGVIKKL